MKPARAFTTGLCLGLIPVLALAPGSVATSAQQSCASWATQQTGYDPARPPPPQAVANPQVTGSGARVRGAAAGAVIGGVAGAAGQGAGAGAVGGAVVHRSRNRRAAREQNEAVAQQQQAGQAAYNQALQACINNRSHQ
jgi:hypothetical protein